MEKLHESICKLLLNESLVGNNQGRNRDVNIPLSIPSNTNPYITPEFQRPRPMLPTMPNFGDTIQPPKPKPTKPIQWTPEYLPPVTPEDIRPRVNESDSLWLSRGTPREQMSQRGRDMGTQSGGYVPQQQNYGRYQPRRPMYKPPAMGQSFRPQEMNPQYRGMYANQVARGRTRRSPYSYDNLNTNRTFRSTSQGSNSSPWSGTNIGRTLNNWQQGGYDPESHAQWLNQQ